MSKDIDKSLDRDSLLEQEWEDAMTPVEEEGEESGEETLSHGAFQKKELDEGEEKEHKKKKTKKESKKKKHAKKEETDDKEQSEEDAEESHSELDEGDEVEEVNIEKDREQVIAEQLAHIYENSDGSMPDMKTFESKKTGKFVRAFIVFLLACTFFGAVAWVGLFALQPRSQFSESEVVLGISGDDLVTPGTNVTYRLRYGNTQNVSLNEVVLEVRYPQGFTILSATVSSTSEKMDAWDLGVLDPGESGYVDITGTFSGDSGSEQSIRAFLSYKPANFTSVFQKVATHMIGAKENVVEVGIEVADEVPRGSKTPVTITITPNNGEKFEYVEVRCVSSDFSESGKSTPEADTRKPCVWSFDSLSDKTLIEMDAIFTSTSSTGNVDIEVRGWNTASKEGEGFVLGGAQKTITIVESETNISLVINGGAGDTTIAPGETISASIVVQNKGEVPLTDVVVEAVIDGPSYDSRSILGWQDLKVTGDADVGGEQLAPDTRRGKITWSKKYLAELASIAPGKQVRLDVSIPIRSGDQITLGNFTTNNIAVTSGFTYGTAQDRKTLSSNQINLALVSDFALEVDHELSNQNGVVGTYDISWKLTNSFHALKNIKLEADIYGDVEVDESKFEKSGGSIVYDASQKRITWTVPEMPTSVDVLNARIPIILKTDNPTQKDLMSKVRMSAEDTIAQITIKKVGEGVALR